MSLQGAEAVAVPQAWAPVGSAVFLCCVWPAQHLDAAATNPGRNGICAECLLALGSEE